MALGSNSSTFGQDGTASFPPNNNHIAFWEAFHADSEPPVNGTLFTASPGDSIRANINYGSSTYSGTVTDVTTGLVQGWSSGSGFNVAPNQVEAVKAHGALREMNQRWLKLILALYPARWRGRYGSELADLVEELFAEGERSRLEIASNLVLGALSERFSPSPLIPLMVIVALMAAAAGVTRLPAHAHSHRDSGAPLISVQRSKSGRITAITGAPVHVVINPRDGHVVSITRRAR